MGCQEGSQRHSLQGPHPRHAFSSREHLPRARRAAALVPGVLPTTTLQAGTLWGDRHPLLGKASGLRGQDGGAFTRACTEHHGKSPQMVV